MKSHVSMEQHMCEVCAKPFDSGSILFDRRLKDSMESKTLTGWGLCKEHKDKHKEGYVALVVIDPSKSELKENGIVGKSDAYRTGEVIHMRRTAAYGMFNIPKVQIDGIVLFIDEETATFLKEKVREFKENEHA